MEGSEWGSHPGTVTNGCSSSRLEIENTERTLFVNKNFAKAEQDAQGDENSPNSDEPDAISVTGSTSNSTKPWISSNRQFSEKETSGSMWPQPESMGK